MIVDAHKHWYETERGVTPETLEAFGVHSANDEWLSLLYRDWMCVRQRAVEIDWGTEVAKQGRCWRAGNVFKNKGL